MIDVVIEEMHGSDCVPDLKTIASEPWLDRQFFNESEMALFSGACQSVLKKHLTPPTFQELQKRHVSEKG
jgi:hypothetical protein